ncbi:MAG: hypothetical protein RIQ54_638, partial [Candidatus Parcubacteria bacterium]
MVILATVVMGTVSAQAQTNTQGQTEPSNSLKGQLMQQRETRKDLMEERRDTMKQNQQERKDIREEAR